MRVVGVAGRVPFSDALAQLVAVPLCASGEAVPVGSAAGVKHEDGLGRGAEAVGDELERGVMALEGVAPPPPEGVGVSEGSGEGDAEAEAAEE